MFYCIIEISISLSWERVTISTPIINQDDDILSGTGETIDEFLDDFPSVTREQVIRFWVLAQEKVWHFIMKILI